MQLTGEDARATHGQDARATHGRDRYGQAAHVTARHARGFHPPHRCHPSTRPRPRDSPTTDAISLDAHDDGTFTPGRAHRRRLVLRAGGARPWMHEARPPRQRPISPATSSPCCRDCCPRRVSLQEGQARFCESAFIERYDRRGNITARRFTLRHLLRQAPDLRPGPGIIDGQTGGYNSPRSTCPPT